MVHPHLPPNLTVNTNKLKATADTKENPHDYTKVDKHGISLKMACSYLAYRAQFLHIQHARTMSYIDEEASLPDMTSRGKVPVLTGESITIVDEILLQLKKFS